MASDLRESAERHRETMRRVSQEKTLAAQDIGEYEPCRHPAERAQADADLRFFLERYFADKLFYEWSPDHLRIIEKLSRTITENMTFAVAMPRGSGKTTLCQLATIWAILTGRHRYVFLIAGTAAKAVKILSNIKSLLRFNDLLYEDYPEALHAIRKLGGQTRKCEGQKYRGVNTSIGWGVDKMAFAMIPGAPAAGALVHVCGMEGDIRGALYVRPDGQQVRPTLVLVDDPQTDESAKSLVQTETRFEAINGAILGLAGPGEATAVLITVTCIRPGDLAERLLDREKSPQWRGEKTKAMLSFPTNRLKWDEYRKVRDEERAAEGDGSVANAFYLADQLAMDEGGRVAWEARKGKKDVSAIQHMMNIMFDRGESTFFAEYQNEPVATSKELPLLSAAQIAAKINRCPRGVVPTNCQRLTAFIDVQQNALYWVVAAWSEGFAGSIVDYGTFPDQRLPYFTYAGINKTLAMVTGHSGVEASIYEGLSRLTNDLIGRQWNQDGGGSMRIERCMIDANWQSDTVYLFCRQSGHAATIMPSHGRFIGGSGKPMHEWPVDEGERRGIGWRQRRSKDRASRYMIYDANYWKSFVFARLAVPMGEADCMTLFGDTPAMHRLYADHMTSEYPIRVTGRGRDVDEWKWRPERFDNHWFDCTVGCTVAASLQGVAAASVGTGQRKIERVSFAAMQAAARGR